MPAVNNFKSIERIAKEVDYLGKWVLLRFIQRRTETGKSNKTIKKQFIKYSKLNQSDIIQFCEDNQCRCYLTFLDNVLESAWKALGSPLDKIDHWRNEEIFNLRGLHLIDVDDLTLEEDNIHWLEVHGINNIYVIPSKTGHSIVFYGSSGLILDYQETGWNEINNFHMMASMNLYIPDFNRH